MGKKKHSESAAKKNPNQPSVTVSDSSAAKEQESASEPRPEPPVPAPESVSKMSANDGEVEDLRHENKMLKEELNAEMEAANELRLAVAHQTSVLYVTAAVAAAAVAAAAYLAAKLRQNQH